MVLRIQIANFKFHQYLPRANSPDLMLARFFRYTVCSSDAGVYKSEYSLSSPNEILIVKG